MAQKPKHDYKYCHQCQRNRTLPYFYSTNKSALFPDGKVSICKDCLKEMVDPKDDSTVLKVLRQIDKPFIREIWDQSLQSKNNAFGDYLRKINSLHQYKDMTYEDGLKGQGLAVDEASSRATKTPSGDVEDSMGDDTYELVKKWGRGFLKEEYERLEELEADMKRSFEINTASQKDYVKQICRTSIMMDRTVLTDPDAFKKYSDIYDKLSRSAKLTEVQRTEADKTGGINSFGQMIEFIEKQGFIPVFHTGEPQDIVDETIANMNNFTRRLVLGEANLSNIVEATLAKANGIDEDEDSEDVDDSELDKDFEFEEDLGYKVED